MKLPLLNTSKTEVGKQEMPEQFDEPVRFDIIEKAVHVMQCNGRQQYGAQPMAGMKYSSYVSKRRRQYRGCYGFGISRTPRKILSRRGTRMNWVGATVPNTVGGRRAHPPKSEKSYERTLPDKERRKAIRSAISATVLVDSVKSRGHVLPKEYPFVVDDDICKINKTKLLKEALMKLDFSGDLIKSEQRKEKVGRGKTRGNRYKERRSVLIVTPGKCPLQLATKNIPGVDVSEVRNLNVEILAPGAVPGRITLWTKGAVEKMKKERLFV